MGGQAWLRCAAVSSTLVAISAPGCSCEEAPAPPVASPYASTCKRLHTLEQEYRVSKDFGPALTVELSEEARMGNPGTSRSTPPRTLPSVLEDIDDVVEPLASREHRDLEVAEDSGPHDRCEQNLALLAKASEPGIDCIRGCADEAGYGRVQDCFQRCLHKDETLENARRAARKAAQPDTAGFVLGVANLPTRRQTSVATNKKDIAVAIELPVGTKTSLDGSWAVGPGTSVALWVHDRVAESSFDNTARSGEKGSALRRFREKHETNRYLRARIGLDPFFTRLSPYPSFRDQLSVQILWDPPDPSQRVECVVRVGALDLDDTVIEAGIAWAEKVCATATVGGS